jgi:hypothetical protein
MRLQITIFALLSLVSLPLFGQSEKRTLHAGREIVRVSADSPDREPLTRPTFTVFVGVPRDAHLHDSLALSTSSSTPIASWKVGITSTVFWAGEPPTDNDPGNLASAWDTDWIETAKSQNPYYVALPYNDIANGHTKSEARTVIPWFREAYVRDGQSVLKDHWVAIRKGARICYAQWEDVGPFQIDHWQYVFGNERPRPNKNRDAGIDVSPAVKDYLRMSGIDSCDWRFASDSEIPQGPWKYQDQQFSGVEYAKKLVPRFAVSRKEKAPF